MAKQLQRFISKMVGISAYLKIQLVSHFDLSIQLNRTTIKRCLLGVLMMLNTSALLAESAKLPIDIIDEMEQLYRGDSSNSRITMVVETPRYKRTMQMAGQSMGKEFGFFRILSPKKDRGIATLKRDEEMWNYFPKINKVIKVPPSMMMGSWMGSDLTNDDLVKETQLIDAYDIEMTETESEYQFSLTPREQTVTVWGHIEYRVSKSPLLPIEQTFFDDKGNKVRVMSFSEPKEFGGRLMPSVLEIKPLRKQGHLTRVIYDEITFNPPGITERTFSIRNLKARF